MNKTEANIIKIIKCAFGSAVSLTDSEIEWDKVFDLGKKHSIIPILYYGLCNLKIDSSNEIYKNMELFLYKSIMVDQNQMDEVGKLKKEFLENDIDFMLLKGSVLKKLYPNSVMRSMGDADILIKTDQYDKIKSIMLKNGYTEQVESDHELIWNKKPFLHLELHKRLIPSYNKDYYEYYGDGWKLAKKIEDTSEYQMSSEDMFVYLFTHFSKHYRDGGIGIRHLVDLWIFLNQNQNMNFEYINHELKVLQLYEFKENIIKTINVWFEDENSTEITDFITDFIFSSGTFGVKENHDASRLVKMSKACGIEKVKKKNVILTIFPSCESLSQKYTILKKAPVLLPFVWVVRWCSAALFRHKEINSKISQLNNVDIDEVRDYQHKLNYVGLDFDFRE